MKQVAISVLKSALGVGMAIFFALGVTADARAEGTQAHSFNGGEITLTVEPTGWPGDSVTICNVRENGGLDSSMNLRQLDGNYSDDLTDPYTFWSHNQRFVIWKTEDANGVLHWWLACWEKPLFGSYVLQWSTEIAHD